MNKCNVVTETRSVKLVIRYYRRPHSHDSTLSPCLCASMENVNERRQHYHNRPFFFCMLVKDRNHRVSTNIIFSNV